MKFGGSGDTRRVSMVAFSGGIDSTYILAHLLRETDDIVIAHHVHMVNAERRWEREAEACAKITKYLTDHYRPFHSTESTVERRSMESFGWDLMTVAAEIGATYGHAASLANVPPSVCFFGLCTDEPAERETWLDRILHSVSLGEGPRYLQHDAISKVDQMRYMGRELSDMCWTCRRPTISQRECSRCMTCELVNGARSELGWLGSRFP